MNWAGGCNVDADCLGDEAIAYKSKSLCCSVRKELINVQCTGFSADALKAYVENLKASSPPACKDTDCVSVASTVHSPLLFSFVMAIIIAVLFLHDN
eukprot:CAMPEP_0172202234 /NCGR_PEP_ID=MMETSP1050-20130122/30518_1 /TAXON_ID=233186 /ORGANISM="Cryptomonas curvata, Strain CCAP979/52" /LENGTH=96 /DNA_ID=CAMNT_0012880121 /DNA_START=30 /DNA_END=320 /DNA_ORIENTATION=+